MTHARNLRIRDTCGHSLIVALVVVAAASQRIPQPAAAQTPAWEPVRFESPLERDEQAELESKRVRWPEPVRMRREATVEQAQYQQEEIAYPEPPLPMESVGDVFAMGDQPPQPPQVPHRVLAAPTPQPTANPNGGAGHGVSGHGILGHGVGASAGHGSPNRPPNHPLHPGYRLHHQIQPVTASIPNAKRQETWKTPYSYGYFGASGTRQWSMHHGYRDRYIEWRSQ
ncbi:hypothetical protein Poly51_04780 [Rubripirellula tenax]|uniref:Uncharacterized protein n=1 Tax=Rubripirellula tenax TaxID=2528015 RepID=A0A5C6FI06_9BACT|nr:hypothetical protein [Rubripirellula tenax]TWU60203.1 hypothetical protein Poly51_04780 [Rubripirellula tenax]